MAIAYRIILALSFLLTALVRPSAQQRFRQAVFDRTDSLVDVVYGSAAGVDGAELSLMMDLHMPARGDSLRRRPTVVFIHGGGFRNGNRKVSIARRLCLFLAKRGYVTATISYRLGIAPGNTDSDYAEAMYRAQQDGRAAIRFLKANADRYGIDTAQVFVAGTSAGAMTALAVGYMQEHEIPAGIDKSRWGGIEGNGGDRAHSSKVAGVVNFWGAIPDLAWVDEGDVPLFNTGGTADKTVPWDSSYAYHGFRYGPLPLYERCLETGVPTGLRPFPGAGHTLDNKPEKLDSCLNAVGDWLAGQLRRNGEPSAGVRRWEREIAAFDSLNREQTSPPGSVMFLGSSYIRMWKNIREDVGRRDVIHRGFGGCNLADVAYYVKRIVYPHRPKALFMYVGNDIVAGGRDKSPEQVLELFKYVVRKVRERYPEMPIAWLQISPSERRWAAWGRISEANELIRAYCEGQPNLHFIRFAEHFLGSDGTPVKSLYLPDKLHYNEEGYRVWGRAIRAEVARIAGF